MGNIKGKALKLSFDFILVAASTWATFYLQYYYDFPSFDGVIRQALCFAGIYTLVSIFFGTYRTIWRYTSVEDLIDVMQASLITLFAFGLFQHFLIPEFIYRPAFIVTQGLLLMAFLAGYRLLRRAAHEGLLKPSMTQRTDTTPRSRVLLVGAGDNADRFVKMVRTNPHYGYEIVGIVDNRGGGVLSDKLHNVPILGKGENLARVLGELSALGKSPQRLVFTENNPVTGSADLKGIPDNLLSRADEYGFKLARLPDLTGFREGLSLDGEDSCEERLRLKPIAIEDLLGRPQAHIDLKSIQTLIAGKRVLITGAGGSIGGELSRQIARLNPASMALLDFSEYNLYALEQNLVDMGDDVPPYRCIMCNIRVAQQVNKIFTDVKPDIVFHAAALKHVPLVELNPSEGVLTNVIGTQIVAQACQDNNVQAMVQISTDKAVNPCNVMGATKRLGEFLSQAMDLENETTDGTRFVTVRFGNVLGSSGSVVPMFRKQLERGGPLKVTHPEISRYFMTIREAVSLVLQSSSYTLHSQAERGRILVLDMGEPVRILDVARQMIRLANLKPDEDIKIEYIGLRPGEKMFEELFDKAEQQVETGSPQILAAVSNPVDHAVLARAVENLEKAANAGDDTAVLQVLKAIVPGYTGDPLAGHPPEPQEKRKKA